MDAICKEGLWKNCVFTSKFRGGIKCSETFLMLILSEENWFPTKTLQQLSNNEEKMLLLTGIVGKAYKVRNLFCLHERRNSCHFLRFWSLERGQNLCMLITFFRSEVSDWLLFTHENSNWPIRKPFTDSEEIKVFLVPISVFSRAGEESVAQRKKNKWKKHDGCYFDVILMFLLFPQLSDGPSFCASYEWVILNPPSYFFGRGGLEVSSPG